MIVNEWTGIEVRALRKSLRITQEVFAEKLGFSVGVVGKWEQAGARQTLRDQYAEAMDTMLAALDDAQLVRFQALLGGDGDVGISSESDTCAGSPATVTMLPAAQPVAETVAADRGEEIVSIPIHADSEGVIGYVMARRDMLARLALAVPAVAAVVGGGLAAVELPGTVALAADEPESAGGNMIDGFLAVTRMFASRRQDIPPDALVGLIQTHRETIADRFRKATTTKSKQRLGSILGETSIVASRFHSAKGDRAMALANCAFARRLADELDDPALGSMARIFESNLRSDAATLIGPDGDVIDGLGLLSQACAGQHLLPAAARARIAAEQAQTYAVLSLERECRDALDRAREAVAGLDGDDTGLFSDWCSARLQVYEGTCWLLLGKPDKAMAMLNDAVAGGDAISRNVALAARVDLAGAHVAAGDLDQGCAILGDTYAELAAMGNRRGLERANQARQRLRPWAAERAVRRLDETIRTLSPAT